MSRTLWILLAVGLAAATVAAGSEFSVTTDTFTARIERGTLVGLTDPSGNAFVQSAGAVQGAGIHREERDHWASASSVNDVTPLRETCSGFEGLDGAVIKAAYATEAGSGDLVITQEAESPKKGVWGVEWAVAGIPSEILS